MNILEEWKDKEIRPVPERRLSIYPGQENPVY